LCLNSNTYHGFSIDDAIEGAARTGLRLIELSAVAGYTEHVMPDFSDDQVEEVLDKLRQHDIRPVALGGHSDLTSRAGRARFESNLDLAVRLGVDYVVTGTGETHGDETLIEDRAEFAGHIREIAERARGRGLKLAIETHGANYATGQAVVELVREVDSVGVGVAYDTANTIFYGATEPYDDLARALPDVVGIHLKDKAGTQDEWNFPAIGDGDTDFRRIRDIV